MAGKQVEVVHDSHPTQQDCRDWLWLPLVAWDDGDGWPGKYFLQLGGAEWQFPDLDVRRRSPLFLRSAEGLQ